MPIPIRTTLGAVVALAAVALATNLVHTRAASAGRKAAASLRLETNGAVLGTFAVASTDVTTEVIEYRDGTTGEVRKLPGRNKFGNIVLKRGFVASPDGLREWFRAVRAGTVERRNGSVVLLDRDGAEIGRYNFANAWPVRWTGWTLEGKNDDTAVEELELAVDAVDLP